MPDILLIQISRNVDCYKKAGSRGRLEQRRRAIKKKMYYDVSLEEVCCSCPTQKIAISMEINYVKGEFPCIQYHTSFLRKTALYITMQIRVFVLIRNVKYLYLYVKNGSVIYKHTTEEDTYLYRSPLGNWLVSFSRKTLYKYVFFTLY